MSKRHVIAFVLLSSTGAFASPAETDGDGFPLVGNMHGKRAAKPDPARIARSALAPFLDNDGYPLVGNMQGKGGDEKPAAVVPVALPGDATACASAIEAILALDAPKPATSLPPLLAQLAR